MSARSSKKSMDLYLSPSAQDVLERYRAANDDESFAAAARRAIRAALGVGRDRAPLQGANVRRAGRRRIRLQLEPAVRNALPPIGATDQEAAQALLETYLGSFAPDAVSWPSAA